MCRTTGTDRLIYISLLGIEEVLSSFLNSSQRVTIKELFVSCQLMKLCGCSSRSHDLLLKKKHNMNIGLSAAALAAMGYFVYSSTSNSSVVLKGKTVLITGAGVRFHSTIIRRRNFYVKRS